MSLGSLELLTSLCRESSKCHALIYLHMLADNSGLANDDSSTVVDKEILAYSCTRMNIYSCHAVGVLSHDPRYHRNIQQTQFMCHAVYRYRIKSRV